MALTVKVTGTPSISHPNRATDAVEQTGQQEFSADEATNISVEQAVNMENSEISGDFQLFPASMVNAVNSDKST